MSREENKNPLLPFAISEWDASLDTSIVIHLYACGKEDLLFFHFERLYLYEYLLGELRANASPPVMEKFNNDLGDGRIIVINQQHLREINYWGKFKERVEEWVYVFGMDRGEAHAAALAQILGLRFLATDDEKEFGPHDILIRRPKEGVIPLIFYELLVFQCLEGNLPTSGLYKEFDSINSTFDMPTDFIGRMKRVYRRFWEKPSSRDQQLLEELCRRYNCSQSQIEQIGSYLDFLRA